MQDQKENIRFNSSGSILLILLLLLGLLIYNKPKSNLPDPKSSRITADASAGRNMEIPCSCFLLKYFEKDWITFRYSLKNQLPDKNPFIENRKTDLQISLLQDIIRNFDIIPAPFLFHHLCAREKDYPPLLS